MTEENPVEYLRQLGANFAAWRRYSLLTNRELLRKMSESKYKITESSLSNFEAGKLADFVLAAMDEMCVPPEVLRDPPPEEEIMLKSVQVEGSEKEEPIEDQSDPADIDAASWVKFEKNTEEEKSKVTKNVESYAERHNLSNEARQDLIDMLTSPARALKTK